MNKRQRAFVAIAAALLTLGIAWSMASAAPQRPPRSTTPTEQRDRPAPTPTVGCYNRMAGTCGHQWYDPNQFDRRTLVPTPQPRR